MAVLVFDCREFQLDKKARTSCWPNVYRQKIRGDLYFVKKSTCAQVEDEFRLNFWFVLAVIVSLLCTAMFMPWLSPRKSWLPFDIVGEMYLPWHGDEKSLTVVAQYLPYRLLAGQGLAKDGIWDGTLWYSRELLGTPIPLPLALIRRYRCIFLSISGYWAWNAGLSPFSGLTGRIVLARAWERRRAPSDVKCWAVSANSSLAVCTPISGSRMTRMIADT